LRDSHYGEAGVGQRALKPLAVVVNGGLGIGVIDVEGIAGAAEDGKVRLLEEQEAGIHLAVWPQNARSLAQVVCESALNDMSENRKRLEQRHRLIRYGEGQDLGFAVTGVDEL